MTNTTIKWTCTPGAGWEWASAGAGNPLIPPSGPISGTITLPPNELYWYPCIDLGLPDGQAGNAMLRLFYQGGTHVVQAMTVAQNVWVQKGGIGKESIATGGGGIDLFVQLA